MLSTFIIQSRLDNDFYNFTMGQLVWKHYRDVRVTYRFTCRTQGAKLGRLINPAKFVKEIDAVRYMRLGPAERTYLESLDLFEAGYLDFLEQLTLPAVAYRVIDGDIDIEYSGPWAEAIFWETPILAIVQEMVNRERAFGHEAVHAVEAEHRLARKINVLRQHPEVRFTEFGTRRRASYSWQRHTVEQMQAKLTQQVLGTSNVHLAMELGLRPSGTMAHQLFMVTTALEHAAGATHPIAASQDKVLDLFEEMYGAKNGGKLLIFLPDTFGSDTALSLLTTERLERWAGMRQDSGDPFEFGEKLIALYASHGIDPCTKTVIFSDGLDVDTMVALQERFGTRIQVGFGWGTNLTNDWGLPSLSIVIKPIMANGYFAAKLSDNLDKATGDPAAIEQLKAEADYHVTFHMTPVV